MTVQNTDFGRVADDLRRAAASFALLTSSASAFGFALNSFRQFEAALISTNAVAQGTAKNFDDMAKAARSFALATTTSTAESIDALQNLAQAGFTAQESLQAMTGVLLLASATMVDAATSADLISANIRAFNLEATDTTRVANLFTAAITSGLASIDKLTFAFRQVAPVAEVANLTIEETTAFLNNLFNVGLRGEQAGTALRNVIIRLVRPTGEAAKVLREIGVATVDATGNFRDLETILQEINSANLGEAQLAKIFENEALAGAITLLKAVEVGVDGTTSAYRDMLKEISGTQDALILTLKNLNSLDAQLKLLSNSVTDLAISVGESFAPYVEALAGFLRDVLQAFRELDPETKQFYTSILAIGAGIVTFLGVLNAMILLFGQATVVTGGFLLSLGGLPFVAVAAGLGSLVGGVEGFIVSLGVAFVAMKAIKAYMAGTFLTTLSATAAALGAFALANPAVLAFAVAVGTLALALQSVRSEAELTADELAKIKDLKVKASIEFERTASGAGAGEFAILELQNQGELARQLINSDLIRALADNDFVTAIQAAQTGTDNAIIAAKEAQASNENLSAELEAIRRGRDKLVEGVAAVSETFAGKIANLRAKVGGASVEDLVIEELDRIDPGIGVQLKKFTEREAQLTAEIEKNEETARLGVEAERTAIARFVQAIATNEAQLPGIYADLGEGIRSYLQTADQAQVDAIIDGLAEGDKEFTIEAFLEELLRTQGVDEGFIAELLSRREKERVRKVVVDLQSIAAELAVENEKVRIAALEFTSKNSEDLQEALRSGLEAANATLELDLEDSVDSFVDKFGEKLATIITQNQVGVQDAIDAAAAGSGFDITSSDSIEEILGGSALIDSINEQVDADTTPEELARIAEEESAKYAILLENILLAVAAATGDAISPEQLDALREIVRERIAAIQGAVAAGANESIESQEAIAKRFEKESDKAKRAADKALKEARDALKNARELEDAFLEAEASGREARERYVEAVRGFSADERIKISLDFEIDAINEDFDGQIRDIERKLEDLSLEFAGDPAQLEKLKEQYGGVIEQINAARDAETAAASAWTASMERRSAALDMFIRDLTDVAMKAKDTFTQVGAGVASAFAEYNKDLITLIDITRDATTSMLDTLTTGVSDFIFENENAWENFKKNMLNISREIFEGFTKSLIQQGISSLTGGGGSILGNSAQPSQFGSETPGVGTGGFFAKLFPGLAGAFGGANAEANAGLGEVAAMTSVSTSMQLSSVSLQSSAVSLQSIAATLTGALGAGGGLMGAISGVLPGPMQSVMGAGLSAAGGAGNAVMATAAKYLGLNENSDNSVLQSLLSVDPAAVAWCADFVNQSLASNGIAGTGSNLAQSFLDFGTAVDTASAKVGDLAIFERGAPGSGMGHVGFINDIKEDGSLDILGGNQSDGVSIANFGTERLLGIRRIEMENTLAESEKLWGDFNQNMDGTLNATTDLFNEFGQKLTGPPQAGKQYFDEAGLPVQPGAGGLFQSAAPGLGGSPAPASGVGGLLGMGTGQPGVPGLPGQGGGMEQIAAQMQQIFQGFLQNVTQTLNQFGQGFANALNSVVQSIQGMATQVQAGGTVSFSSIGGATGGGGGLGGVLGFLGNLFDTGGYTGDGARLEPAGIVHRGEFVTNAAATKAFYPLLDAINEGSIKPDMAEAILAAMGGRLPGYATGGLVGTNFVPSNYGMADSSLSALGIGAKEADAKKQQTVKEGDNISLNVVYNMNGARGSDDRFSRSASQHAKVLMRQIERAKRNT
jgi:TP901 family phage tail tape measure protein